MESSWKVLYEGHMDVEYTDEVEPADVYDEHNVEYDFDKKEWKYYPRLGAKAGVRFGTNMATG